MAKQEYEEYIGEEAPEEFEYEEVDAVASRRWILIGATVAVLVCLGLAVVLWLGRESISTAVSGFIASSTPTLTATLPATATSAPKPTNPPTEPSVVSDTPEPTPDRAPPMEIMSLTEGPPVLDEKFADNTNNWLGLSPASEFTIQENQIRMKSNEAGQVAVVYCGGDACSSFEKSYYYQAEVVEDRPTTQGIGLVFGLDTQRKVYYAFKIKPDSGTYSLVKLVDGNWSPLVDWTPSPAIFPNPKPNLLGVSYQDGNIDLYVNNSRVNSYKDKNPYDAGRVGLFAEQDGVRLMGSNVQVYQLRLVTPGAPVVPPGGQTTGTAFVPPTSAPYTPTPTAYGSCPPEVGKSNWVLVVTSATSQKNRITINGVQKTIVQGANVFYLPLNTDVIVKIGARTYEYFFSVCKIIYLKAK
jgi:hypothetical protein